MSSIDKKDLINEIVHRLEEKTLSVFLGAGMSYDACCLDWTTLIKPYAEQLDTEVKDPIDALQYYQTSKGVEPVALKKEISDNFLGLKGDIRHQILSKLPIRNYWTTNFDTIMEDSITEVNFKRDIINNNDAFITAQERRDNVVYKLHGDVNTPKDVVILRDDYDNYPNTHSHFITALTNEFATNSMLFLGYSLNDPDIYNVLNCLKLHNTELNQHFLILKRDEKSETLQNYRMKELEKKGIITCFIDNYSEVGEILHSIYKKYMARKVFISGSSNGDYGPYTKEEAQDMLYKLGYNLINENKEQSVDLISGYGLGVGSFLVEGAAEAVATNNLDFAKRILIYPFPKMYYNVPDSERSEELKKHFVHYREKMIDKCGIAFFMFGTKTDKGTGETVVASGMLEEFKIAHRQGKYVFPIGVTGGAAKILADKVLDDYKAYNDTPLEVEKLFLELNTPGIDTSQIIENMLQIIDLLAYRFLD